jgi:hypothetical protein
MWNLGREDDGGVVGFLYGGETGEGVALVEDGEEVGFHEGRNSLGCWGGGGHGGEILMLLVWHS